MCRKKLFPLLFCTIVSVSGQSALMAEQGVNEVAATVSAQSALMAEQGVNEVAATVSAQSVPMAEQGAAAASDGAARAAAAREELVLLKQRCRKGVEDECALLDKVEGEIQWQNDARINEQRLRSQSEAYAAEGRVALAATQEIAGGLNGRVTKLEEAKPEQDNRVASLEQRLRRGEIIVGVGGVITAVAMTALFFRSGNVVRPS